MAKRISHEDLERAREKLRGRPLVLVGLMGSGKSSIGRRLAEKLDLPFFDADHEIEEAAGKSIQEIFADHGEDYFRDGEKRVIARLLENGPQILATGGGAYINSETRRRIKAASVSLWLKADLKLLVDRVAKRGNRPLLKDDPEGVLRKLIDSRYPIYGEADITVKSRDAAHGHMVSEIIRALNNWEDPSHPTPQESEIVDAN